MTKPVTRKMAVDCLLLLVEMAETVLQVAPIIVCPECKMPVRAGQPIQFDHRHGIVHGGPHEHQNLRPLHTDCHKKKTARDIKANAKIKRLTGQTKGPPKRKWAKQKMKSGKTKWPKRPMGKRK